MAAAIGQRFANDRIVILEQANRYRLPVYPGDTLTSLWKIVGLRTGRQAGQQVLGLTGELMNQRHGVVIDSTAKLLLTVPTRSIGV